MRRVVFLLLLSVGLSFSIVVIFHSIYDIRYYIMRSHFPIRWLAWMAPVGVGNMMNVADDVTTGPTRTSPFNYRVGHPSTRLQFCIYTNRYHHTQQAHRMKEIGWREELTERTHKMKRRVLGCLYELLDCTRLVERGRG